MCGAPVGKACHLMSDPRKPCATHSGRVRERFRLQGEADRA